MGTAIMNDVFKLFHKPLERDQSGIGNLSNQKPLEAPKTEVHTDQQHHFWLYATAMLLNTTRPTTS